MTAHFPMPTATSHYVISLANLHDPCELQRINAYVQRHAQTTPFHLCQWGCGVSQGTGQEFFYLIAEATNGDLQGVLPGHVIHSPLFGRALVSTGFAVGGGILSENAGITDALSEAFWQQAQIRSCETAELRGGQFPRGTGWAMKHGTYAGFAGPLVQASEDADEQQLLAIPRKQRAEVRKGLNNDLTIRTGRKALDREEHYAIYAESVRNLGTPVFPKSLFDSVLDSFGDSADILTVLNGDRPVASVLSLYHNDTVYPYWGGGIWDARALRANDVMYYALMNHARGKCCTRFDFGRSKIGTGPYNFKKNWGFEPAPLSYAVRTADGAEPRDINPMSPKYRMQVALWQKLPMPIANRIGPWIARGLG